MKVYILAPSNRTSGGPELAHQLCRQINDYYADTAYMCYVDVSAPFDKALGVDAPAPSAYEIYHTEHITDVAAADTDDAFFVFPEGLTLSMAYIKHAKKVLWWMSVDNYIVSTKESNLERITNEVCLHLYQSYYAKDYVEKKIPGANGMYLSDYINQEHGKFLFPGKMRKNIALYNPAKGYEELKPLKDKATWLEWIALTGLDVPHMVFIMQNAKIYIDFGNHPGKDRIPREAAANGCCVITNTNGAAAFEKDVPIPDQYKFSSPTDCIDELDSLLHDICDNFQMHQDDFADYRKMIASEKALFEKDCRTFMEKIGSL
jgi:hypothetical protein